MPLVKLGLVFFVIIYLTRKKCPLGYAMLIGSGMLGVLFGMGGLSVLRSAAKACIDLTTLELASIVALIIVLSSILEEKGHATHHSRASRFSEYFVLSDAGGF